MQVIGALSHCAPSPSGDWWRKRGAPFLGEISLTGKIPSLKKKKVHSGPGSAGTSGRTLTRHSTTPFFCAMASVPGSTGGSATAK